MNLNESPRNKVEAFADRCMDAVIDGSVLALPVALVLLSVWLLSGCASMKPEILCNPYNGQASVVQSVSVFSSKQEIRAERECANFKTE